MSPKASQYFETRKRGIGATFVTLKDDRPEWLQDAVRAAHQGAMPSDWVYSECRAAIEAIEQSDDPSGLEIGDLHEHVDSQVDVYTKARHEWAAMFCPTSLYSEAEERAAEMGSDASQSIADRIGVIQYCAIEAICATMLAAYQSAMDDE